MLIRTILKAKAVAGVITIGPGASLAEAATHLSARNIGALVVSETGAEPLGILSERDIVRELGRKGPGCMTQTVAETMTRDVVMCTPADTTDTVLGRMAKGHFRHMPVIEDGRMIGFISIGDVVKAQIGKLAMEKEALQGMISGGY